MEKTEIYSAGEDWLRESETPGTFAGDTELLAHVDGALGTVEAEGGQPLPPGARGRVGRQMNESVINA